jgi:hypothetical protein
MVRYSSHGENKYCIHNFDVITLEKSSAQKIEGFEGKTVRGVDYGYGS